MALQFNHQTETITPAGGTLNITGAINATGGITGGTFNPSLIQVSAGAVGAPSISFAADPDTGLYSVGANQIGVTAGNSLILTLGSTIVFGAAVTMTGQTVTGGTYSGITLSDTLAGTVTNSATFNGGTFSGIILSGTTTLPGSGSLSSGGVLTLGNNSSGNPAMVLSAAGAASSIRFKLSGDTSSQLAGLTWANNSDTIVANDWMTGDASAGIRRFQLAGAGSFDFITGTVSIAANTPQVRISHTASVDRSLIMTGGASGSSTQPTISSSSGTLGLSGILQVADTTAPGGSPSSSVFLYSEAGVLKWKSPGGTIYDMTGVNGGNTNFGSTVAVNSGGTRTTSDIGKIVRLDASTAGFTMTLPTASDAGNLGSITLFRFDNTANVVTIATQGSDRLRGADFWDVASTTLTTRGSSLVIASDGTHWYVLAQSVTSSTNDAAAKAAGF